MNALGIILIVLTLVAVSFPITTGVQIIVERVREKAWEAGYEAGKSVNAPPPF